MNVQTMAIPDVLLIEPTVFSDERGIFVEMYHRSRYSAAGIDREFVQDNFIRSHYATLRGLHYQVIRPQGKLVWVTHGKVYDVAVDLRRSSATFGRTVAVVLSADNHHQLYIPPGCAHGLCALSDTAEIVYKCTEFYAPSQTRTILWNDPDLAIEWPIKSPILSERDVQGASFRDAEVFA